MLNVYQVTDSEGESVWAVVDSEDKALAVYHDYLDEDADGLDAEVRLLPDDEVLELGNDENREVESKTAREWADTYGEGTGFLASTVW